MKLVHAFAAAAALFAAAPALADPPAPYYEVSGTLKYLQPNPDTGSNDIKSLSISDLGSYSTSTGINPATLTVGATPSPFLQLQTTSGYNDHKATIRYSYRVFLESIADAPTSIVQLANIAGVYQITTSNGPSTVIAKSALYADLTGNPQTFRADVFSPMISSQNFSLTGAGTLLEAGYLIGGVSYDVYGGNLALSLSTVAYGGGLVMIDPVITANTAGVQAAGYSPGGALVQVPDGFGNPGVPAPVFSATPEPANWALLIGGFGLVGLGARRRSLRAHLA